MEYRINPMLAANVARCLKEEFKLEDKLKDDENPRRYMKNLIKVRRILSEDYDYHKTDQDILDQMIKVLNKDYKIIKRKLKDYRRYGIDLDLDEVLNELEEKYQELKQ